MSKERVAGTTLSAQVGRSLDQKPHSSLRHQRCPLQKNLGLPDECPKSLAPRYERQGRSNVLLDPSFAAARGNTFGESSQLFCALFRVEEEMPKVASPNASDEKSCSGGLYAYTDAFTRAGGSP
jgi:hypothetical protein